MAGSITASAFNRLGQYASNPGNRAYCYAELAVSFLKLKSKNDNGKKLKLKTVEESRVYEKMRPTIPSQL